jgi:hypothetical protein
LKRNDKIEEFMASLSMYTADYFVGRSTIPICTVTKEVDNSINRPRILEKVWTELQSSNAYFKDEPYRFCTAITVKFILPGEECHDEKLTGY